MMSKMLLKYIKISRLGGIFCRSTTGYVISETYDWAFLSRVQLPFYWTHLNYKILNLLWTTNHVFSDTKEEDFIGTSDLFSCNSLLGNLPSFPGKKIWMFPQQDELVTHLELATLATLVGYANHPLSGRCIMKSKECPKKSLPGPCPKNHGISKIDDLEIPKYPAIQSQTPLFRRVPADS